MKNVKELIERLELANGCLIGSHISGNTPRQQFETIIKELKQVENLSLCAVSNRRELLIAYEKNHYTPQEWVLASKQCIEDIDNFLAINCG